MAVEENGLRKAKLLSARHINCKGSFSTWGLPKQPPERFLLGRPMQVVDGSAFNLRVPQPFTKNVCRTSPSRPNQTSSSPTAKICQAAPHAGSVRRHTTLQLLRFRRLPAHALGVNDARLPWPYCCAAIWIGISLLRGDGRLKLAPAVLNCLTADVCPRSAA